MNYELRDWVSGMFESSVETQYFVFRIINIIPMFCANSREAALQRLMKTANRY